MNKRNPKNSVSKFATIDEARERYRIGRKAVYDVARRCGAMRKIGRSVRFDIEKIDAYFDDMI